MKLEVKEYHKRRRSPLPASISLKETQTLQFVDSRFLLSPYRVEAQGTIYRLEKDKIIFFTDNVDNA